MVLNVSYCFVNLGQNLSYMDSESPDFSLISLGMVTNYIFSQVIDPLQMKFFTGELPRILNKQYSISNHVVIILHDITIIILLSKTFSEVEMWRQVSE